MKSLALSCAGLFVAASVSAALALPSVKSVAVVKDSAVHAIKDDKDHDKKDREKDHDKKKHEAKEDEHAAHDRYKGWHHHDHMPKDWREKNCIQAGGHWYCP